MLSTIKDYYIHSNIVVCSDNWGTFYSLLGVLGMNTTPLVAHTSLVSPVDPHCHKSGSWYLLADCTDTSQMCPCWDRSVPPLSVAPPVLMSTNITTCTLVRGHVFVVWQSQLIYVESGSSMQSLTSELCWEQISLFTTPFPKADKIWSTYVLSWWPLRIIQQHYCGPCTTSITEYVAFEDGTMLALCKMPSKFSPFS